VNSGVAGEYVPAGASPAALLEQHRQPVVSSPVVSSSGSLTVSEDDLSGTRDGS
jgi:hypothetical protein